LYTGLVAVTVDLLLGVVDYHLDAGEVSILVNQNSDGDVLHDPD